MISINSIFHSHDITKRIFLAILDSITTGDCIRLAPDFHVEKKAIDVNKDYAGKIHSRKKIVPIILKGIPCPNGVKH